MMSDPVTVSLEVEYRSRYRGGTPTPTLRSSETPARTVTFSDTIALESQHEGWSDTKVYEQLPTKQDGPHVLTVSVDDGPSATLGFRPKILNGARLTAGIFRDKVRLSREAYIDPPTGEE